MNKKIRFNSKKWLLILLGLLCLNLYAQNTDSQFKTFFEGQPFTSVAVDKNKNVWAGTDRKGLFFLNQDNNEAVFNKQNIGTDPALSSLRIQSLATDLSGNVWVGHGGTNTSNAQGGLERINVNTFEVQHLSPDRDTRGMGYLQRDGLGTLNAQQIVVDSNNIVWVAHRYHDLTSTGAGGSSYIITPGTFSSRKADDYSGKFDAVSTWMDYSLKNEDSGLPYPNYTYNPGPSDPVSTRTCNAISAYKDHVWVSVHGYTSILQGFLPARLLQYDSNGNFIKGHTLTDAGFTSGMIFHAVYNNDKGVWATTPIAGNGFSVFKNGYWYNIKDTRIIPPNTRFNAKAIWGDISGRVYLGTDKGLIVYNGEGPVESPDSYKLYTKEPYGSLPESIHDPEMLSNNIIAGISEGPYYSWIATDSGIMRGFFPPGKITVCHVVNKNLDYKEKEFYSEDNCIPFAELNSYKKYLPPKEDAPSFASDGTTSSYFRYYTKDAASFYPPVNKYGFEIGNYLKTSLPEIEGTEEYKARYGEFILRPADTYDVEDLNKLEYIDVVYKHPEYINEKEYVGNSGTDTGYPHYMLYIRDNSRKPFFEEIFQYPVKFSLPPVLLGHGVWTNISSMAKIEDFLLSKGYTQNEILKAWRLNSEDAENPFEADAHIIPTYIKKLRMKALGSKVSAGKVNVIVHSRGGLYTRAYIEGISPNNPYNKDINSLITLNTPHAGSQEANAVMDQRVVFPEITYIPLSDIYYGSIDEAIFEKTDPIKIGDIFKLAAVPEKDRIKNWGAKNLMVTIDFLSGSIDNFSGSFDNHFIEKINNSKNLIKLKEAQVPIHAVATNFTFKELNPSIPIKAEPYLIGTKLAFESLKFLLDKSVNTLDKFMKYLFNDETNDFIVPDSSMKAGLTDPKHYSSFQSQNAPHVDPLAGATGVCGDPVVHEKLYELLKEDLRLSDKTGSFTKNGLKPPNLSYMFLAGYRGFSSSDKKELKTTEGRILIDKNSFTSDIVSGKEISFDIHQKNLDKIIIIYEFYNFGGQYIQEEEKLNYKNTFSFTIPDNFFGEFLITAYGFTEGQLASMHTISQAVKLPANISLESIRFSDSRVTLSEQGSYDFSLLGIFSDGIEREVNNMEGITFTVENENILKLIDSKTLKGLIPGETILTASAGLLSADLKLNIEEDPILLENIVFDFYPEYQETGPVTLNWNTYQEYKSKSFILERSENNDKNFIQINQQQGKGTSYDYNKYSFSDNTSTVHAFYRLKLYDTDNKEVYNQTIEVNRESLSVDETNKPDKKDKWILTPNPLTTSTGSLYIQSNFIDEHASLNIYDSNGRLISSKKYIIEKGGQKISFEMPSGAVNGIYLIQLKTNNYIKTGKLILKR